MPRSMTHTLNALLMRIGENGLSGIHIPAGTPAEALGSLLKHLGEMSSQVPASRIMSELRRQELVTIVKQPDSILFQLTVKGVHRVQRAQLRSITIPPQTPWDRRWRMVVFDIPSRHAESRYMLTSELRRLGFIMLQNSMWVHPYPCFAEISAVIQYSNLQPFVTMAEVSRIDTASLQKLLVHYPELQTT